MAERKDMTVICPDCGKVFATKYKQTVRCKECAKKHKLAYNKEWNRLHRHKKSAKTREQLEREELHTLDTKENIHKCLNCTLPKCRNCLSYRCKKKTGKKYERKKGRVENG